MWRARLGPLSTSGCIHRGKLNDASALCQPDGIISQQGGAHESPFSLPEPSAQRHCLCDSIPFPLNSSSFCLHYLFYFWLQTWTRGAQSGTPRENYEMVKTGTISCLSLNYKDSAVHCILCVCVCVCVCTCVQDANLSSIQVEVLGACVIPQWEIQYLAEMLQGLAYKYL